ncbi:MAG: M28 family peptidase [Promethearchaeota archaeon]
MTKIEDYNKLTEEAIDYITDVCNKFGPRISGTKEERESLEELETLLQAFSDFTYFDSYKVYPTFYPGGFVTIFGILVILGVFTFFFRGLWALLSLFLPLFGLFIFFVSLVLMKYWFAFLSRKGTSHNATGRILPRNPDGEKVPGKLKIIIAGHMDSAFQMKITRFGDKSALFFKTTITYIVSIVILSALKVVAVQFTNIQFLLSAGVFGLTWIDFVFLAISLIGFPVFVITLLGFIGGTPVLGANDNLSGVGLALAIGKYFSKDEHRLNNVELWVGSFGSEECGERGSEAFIKKYSKLGLLDNCVAVIPESLGAGTHLAILTKELMHLATHDITVCKELDTAYISLADEIGKENVVHCRIAPELKMGASDGGRFALAGYSSSTLVGYEGTKSMKPANWHNIQDKPENLSKDIFRTSLGIYIHFIKQMEKELE